MSHSVVSLFCGCGGKTLGATRAGFTPVLSVEYDPAIAAVYADNFGAESLLVRDVRDVDYAPFAGADLLMASPVCTRASRASASAGEAELDISCAEAVARAIRQIRPRWFLLENVAAYRSFASLGIITNALDECGIWWDANVLNAADFGVPQSRVRLIVRGASDGYLPPLPTPTPRRGWYDAIADLLPDCTESKLAAWQIKRLPEKFSGLPFVFDNEHNIRTATVRSEDDQMFTVSANNAGRRPRNAPCAILPHPFSHETLSFLSPDDPAPTLTASQPKHPLRAIIIGSEPVSLPVLIERDIAGDRPPTIVVSDKPSFTITTSKAGRRESIVPLVIDSCRVVMLNTHCLARLQSFPDSFLFPPKRSVAGQCIGNAVPPAMAYGLITNLTGVTP